MMGRWWEHRSDSGFAHARNTEMNPHYRVGSHTPMSGRPETQFLYFYHPDHLGSTEFEAEDPADVGEDPAEDPADVGAPRPVRGTRPGRTTSATPRGRKTRPTLALLGRSGAPGLVTSSPATAALTASPRRWRSVPGPNVNVGRVSRSRTRFSAEYNQLWGEWLTFTPRAGQTREAAWEYAVELAHEFGYDL